MRKFSVLILVVGALVLAGCAAQSGALALDISSSDAYQLYQKGDTFFLDVREQDEWDAAHIPNTVLIPLGQLQSRLAEVPKDKAIVVVCRSGNRSKSGRDILLGAGYTNVTSMTGGIKDWTAQGYPVGQ